MTSIHSAFVVFLAHILLLLGLPAGLVDAHPVQDTPSLESRSSDFWLANIKHQGVVPGGHGPNYQVFRNVKDFGAKGDGVTDDTDAINKAMSSGNRCGEGCDSSTVTPALVYIPPGTYVVSKPIIAYYYTQIIGDPLDRPVIKGSPEFAGMALIDSDPYTDQGDNWYTNQNNFFRSVRHVVIDLTAMPQGSGAGIHWQVGQATDLRNVQFDMVKGGGPANKQQGIFMDNGSGGFMADLVFNGGNYGMFVGNQQFTTRNLIFNDCNTAIFMNWNWAWTFKSVTINNCHTGLNMSNSPQDQTVGSVLLLDSKFTNTPTGVITAWTKDSVPEAAGALILDNVDFSGSKAAVAGIDGSTILHGGSVVANWVQGNTYTPSKTLDKRDAPAHVVTQTVKRTTYVCPEATKFEPSEPSTSSTSVATGLSPVSTASQFEPNEPTTTATSAATGLSPADTSTASQFEPNEPTTSSPSAATGLPPAATFTPPSGTSSFAAIIPSISVSLPVIGSSRAATPTATPSAHPSASAPAGGSTCANGPVSRARTQSNFHSPAKPRSLVDGAGNVFQRSRPSYEHFSASSIVSVRSAGAKGDGKTDDTHAIQKVFDNAKEGQVVFFDHGAYVITSTVNVPKNIKITGEVWPILMAHGKKFSDQKNPIPMLRIGEPGDKGSVEMSDLLVGTSGPAPGAILIEWNLAEDSQGSAAMWDMHARVGGSASSGMLSNTCMKTPNQKTEPNPKCIGAFMLFHVTKNATPYIENAWFWTADHDLDSSDHSQINIYTGRGVLVESNGPTWMYGTAAEHNQLYNYQVDHATDIFMGFVQTETPYYQDNPNALVPFHPQKTWNDPEFSWCKTDSCRKAWGLRVLGTSGFYLYGAGLYSFFENYGQDCIKSGTCQENILEVDCSDVHMYALSTIASVNMVTSADGKSIIPKKGNKSTFCSTVALFEQ